MNFVKTLFLTMSGLFALSNANAQPGIFHDSRDKVGVSVQVSPKNAIAGSDAIIAVILEHEEHWHSHTNEPQVPEALGDPEDYIATSIAFELPEGSPLTVHDGFIQWPEPTIVEVGFAGTPVDYGVFSGKTVIYIPLTIASDAKIGDASFTIKTVFQACDDTTCLMPTPQSGGWGWDEYGITSKIAIVSKENLTPTAGSSTFDLFDGSVFADIRAGVKAPDNNKIEFDAFGLQFSLTADGPSGLFLLLLVAMCGGFLLNLTPCVLPVIPIKIMGLSASAGNRKKTLILGAWMMFGVMALWIFLGVAIAVVAGFTAINQLFQYPAFTIILGVFIGIMAIGMGGLFSIRLPNVIYKVNPKHDSWYGSFLFGVMTAVLSTPCTAPFMGAAAAWAATQSAILTLTVFGSIGFGMAFPYLILAAFPHLVDKMPRAGASSEVIKQVMGLLMLAAATYFLGVGLSGLLQEEGAPPSRIYLWVVAACVASAGIWLAWRTLRIAKNTAPKIIFASLGIVVAVSSIFGGIRLTEKGPVDWEYYTPELLTEKLAEGDVVVLEFTAEWCLNCKALESTVLHSKRVVEAFSADDVTPIKIDLTGNNISGNALLNELGGLRIPLLIVMGPDGEEDFRGDFYTVDQVLEAIKKSRGGE
ncbi:MAG: thioredoxin family protein [Phycisphaerales bacterium]|nr:thioredoxin family protein [Planctomycetota bacterium]MBL6996910.1 thioredoxin family protein [Phycisphaerales bacterium]